MTTLITAAKETIDNKDWNQISEPSAFRQNMGLVGGAHSRGLTNLVPGNSFPFKNARGLWGRDWGTSAKINQSPTLAR